MSSTRTYGVEIECGIPTAQHEEFCRAMGSELPRWMVRYDGSLHRDGNDWQMREVVSPVLSGQEGLDAIADTCRVLRRFGAGVNRSCGLHVHVAHRNAPGHVVAHLDDSFEHYQAAFYGMAGRGVRHRMGSNGQGAGWCKRKAGRSGDYDRYCALNISHYMTGARPTLEYRVFGPTTNVNKLTADVCLAVGLTECAMREEDERIGDAAQDPRIAMENLIALLGRGDYFPADVSEATRDAIWTTCRAQCANAAATLRLA